MRNIWILTLFLLASCEEEELFSGDENQQIKRYISLNKLKITDSTATGLKVAHLKRNTANRLIRTNQTVTIEFSGTLLSGKKFDLGKFTFIVGIGGVIKGLDVGVSKMRLGEKAKLIFPSSLGYGAESKSNIPANSPLVFDIEVLALL
jgi:FKBP-type peptidyl-prolyl cis-trans isomerase